MKLAASLALALALLVGIWAIMDYSANEDERQRNVQKMINEEMGEYIGRAPDDSAFDHAKEIAKAERYDAIMGIVAACALVGAVVLFSKSGKGESEQT